MTPTSVKLTAAWHARLSAAAEAVITGRGITILRHGRDPVHLDAAEARRLVAAWHAARHTPDAERDEAVGR